MVDDAVEEGADQRGEKPALAVGDRADVNEVVAAVGPVFKDIRPAASMLIVQMIEEGMKIEIEVTARIGAATSHS